MSATSPDGRYHYLFALNVRYPDGSVSVGNTAIVLPEPIRTFTDVQRATAAFRQYYPNGTIVVTNLMTLSGPADTRHEQCTASQGAAAHEDDPTAADRREQSTALAAEPPADRSDDSAGW